jgi:hypothetical protein
MIPVAIIGGGPAGLMAAEQLTRVGIAVELFDSMPSVGRKLLLAGIGGLNITHSEPTATFLGRYGQAQSSLQPVLAEFAANELRAWVHDLGIETFVGSSGRVFPKEMKAAPLLRRWLKRLRAQGLVVHTRHRCFGINKGSGNSYELTFETANGHHCVHAGVVILAMGGASWPRLGSDGAWQQWLAPLALAMQPLRPANCGFQCIHSNSVKALAGSPLKNITLVLPWLAHSSKAVRGEAIITEWGIEGSLIYAHSAMIRDRIEAAGYADIVLNLLPDQPAEAVFAQLQQGNRKHSLSRQWQGIGLNGIKAALVRDALPKPHWSEDLRVVETVKVLTLRLTHARPLDEAISTAGGLCWSELMPTLASPRFPGLFFAGEMIDWEAPTGGYLLTACFATGRTAGLAAQAFLTDDLRLSRTQGYN